MLLCVLGYLEEAGHEGVAVVEACSRRGVEEVLSLALLPWVLC